ncbi:hypothetical protein BWI93_03095 [Siphonobacter sp. BAB-5385]|uniref:hypothetical protein n=1 Tax=Siphonobacter sp. BAB-5385 TaxID=1864822 RepID=UPI000B9E9962|nr:hypothetical protein [Siphonobacter sp. BAB-5385]OZI09582.1 hypothetical protein BWI93_03095 [Siphonobacter sp. BAB-5385]
MASVVTLGLASIEVGAVAADGGPGTTLTSLGYTFEDSCTMTQDDPEVNEFFAEEVEDPIVRKMKKGRTTFAWQLMDPDAETLQKIFGGTVSSGTPKTWSAPDVTPSIEQTVKITPHEGLVITIPRGSLVAKVNAQFSRKGMFLVDISVVPLKPKKAGVGTMQATNPA